MRRLFLIVMMGAFGVGRTAARANEESYAPVDPEITQVQAGCRWKEGSREGRYRAVVKTSCSPEHCHDHLILELLEDRRSGGDREGPNTNVVAKKIVKEVGGLSNVVRIRFLPSLKVPRLEIEQMSLAVEKHWFDCLTLDVPEKYASKPGRCR